MSLYIRQVTGYLLTNPTLAPLLLPYALKLMDELDSNLLLPQVPASFDDNRDAIPISCRLNERCLK